MMISICGLCSHNTGDRLMLRAIVEHFAPSGHELCADYKIAPYSERARLGLYQRVRTEKYPLLESLAGRVLSQRTRTNYGLVLHSEVDAVLDASGFAYSDQWISHRGRRTAALYTRWKRAGRKIVLLPQALGPFKVSENRISMLGIADAADLVFARDRLSYEYVDTLDFDKSKLHVAPDFTNLVEPPAYHRDLERVVVIPNMRMIDKVDRATGACYADFLKRCAATVRSLGLRPVILVHEEHDAGLAQSLADGLDFALEVVRDLDPLETKAYVGGSRFAISSRFHGAVNALSQCVPCFATAWTHKYRMLLEEYGCSEFLLDPCSADPLDERMRPLTDDSIYDELTKRILAGSEVQKRRTREMWEMVDAELGRR